LQWFVFLVAVALGLGVLLPPDGRLLADLHVSVTVYHITVGTLLLAYTVGWSAAFYTFTMVRGYARSIYKTVEGKAFQKIAVGMGVLVFGLVLSVLIGLVSDALLPAHPWWRAVDTLNRIYGTLLVTLVAFTFISTGTRMLVSTTRIRPGVHGTRWFAIIFLTVSVSYLYLLLRDYELHRSAYYLNPLLLLATFVVPRLYAWFLAFISALEFQLYARHVSGLVYKRALHQLSLGITVALSGSVIIQFVTTAGALQRNRIYDVLPLMYVLLVVIAVGFIIMALGTRKLKRIEDV
jgi:hypothetical protein